MYGKVLLLIKGRRRGMQGTGDFGSINAVHVCGVYARSERTHHYYFCVCFFSGSMRCIQCLRGTHRIVSFFVFIVVLCCV